MKRNKLHCIALSVISIFYSFHVTASQNIIVDNSKKRDLSVEIKDEIEHINIEKRMKMVFRIITIKSLM